MGTSGASVVAGAGAGADADAGAATGAGASAGARAGANFFDAFCLEPSPTRISILSKTIQEPPSSFFMIPRIDLY